MTEIKKKETKKKTAIKPEAIHKFSGKYITAIGRRKTATAQIRMYEKGEGVVIVNNMTANDYFNPGIADIALQPIKLTNVGKDFDFSIVVAGSGKKSQAEAARHGISRILVKYNAELKPVLKAKNLMTRDARKKERKKPGLKKARRAPQWAKR